jgi:hypothetical protein
VIAAAEGRRDELPGACVATRTAARRGAAAVRASG